MMLFVLGMILFIGAVVAIVANIKLSKTDKKVGRICRIGGFLAIIVSVVIVLASFIVTVSPGHVGIAYHLSGASTNLKVGYNFVSPWAKIHIWDVTTHVVTFSEGEAIDDIYGAQTSEKDYITVVATLGVRIDTSKMEEYVSLYGNEQITSQRIMRLLKTISRNSIEYTIGSYKTAEVMSNKKGVAVEAGNHFRSAVANLPIVVDSFTIDDLVAPESYENAIRQQAQLRMDKANAELQQEVNAAEAEANRIRAEGEATVAQTQANSRAEVARIDAENDAQVAKIKAENDAEVARINAEADASVKVTQAEAAATATVKAGEAEAKAVSAQGKAYAENPQLLDLKLAEITAEVQIEWAKKWSGYTFEGLNGITFTNLTDILKNFFPN